MIKYFFSALLAIFFSATSFSQTIKPKLDQVKNDPQTIVNAVKADALIIDKKKITESTPATPKKKDRKCTRAKKKNKIDS